MGCTEVKPPSFSAFGVGARRDTQISAMVPRVESGTVVISNSVRPSLAAFAAYAFRLSVSPDPEPSMRTSPGFAPGVELSPMKWAFRPQCIKRIEKARIM